MSFLLTNNQLYLQIEGSKTETVIPNQLLDSQARHEVFFSAIFPKSEVTGLQPGDKRHEKKFLCKLSVITLSFSRGKLYSTSFIKEN